MAEDRNSKVVPTEEGTRILKVWNTPEIIILDIATETGTMSPGLPPCEPDHPGMPPICS